MSDGPSRQRLLDARANLIRVLSEIADAAAQQSLTRCPYRTRDDGCTFRGDCRNQIVLARAARRCAGGTLDSRPASAQEVAAVLDELAAS